MLSLNESLPLSRSQLSLRRRDCAWVVLPLLIPLGLFFLRPTPAWAFGVPGALADWGLALLQKLFLGALGLTLAASLVRTLFFPPAAEARRMTAAAWPDLLRLTKPALNAMVLVSTLMGFYLASSGPLDRGRLILTLAGVGCLAGAASALNQVMERARDRRMLRTARRPLPAHRLALRPARVFGLALALAGMAILALGVNLATAFGATLSLAVYLYIYTPLKPISSLSTLAGAVSGALPPLLGWLGAGSRLSAGAIDLFFVLFLWQIPHFLAIAWKYRDQYRRAGFKLYSVSDPTGHATGLQALLYALALLPASLMMTWHGLTGLPFLLGAFALGLALIGFSAAFAVSPTPVTTRRLFIASIGYLPLLLLFMIIDQWMK